MNRTPKHNLKEKKCKHCGAPFLPRRPLQSLCSPLCAITVVKEVTEKTRKRDQEKREKRLRAENREAKERLKTPGDWRNALQEVMNTIVRLIDAKCKCISCGKYSEANDAGHYRSVGGHETLRFHLMNIYLQCKQCNRPRSGKSGNIANYVDGIIEVFGSDHFDYIRDLRVQYPELKMNVVEIREAISVAKEIIKKLEKANKVDSLPRSPEDRIRLRKEFNERLKIYA